MKSEDRNGDEAAIHLLCRNVEVGNMPIEEHAVSWDGPGSPSPRLRLLLLSDVDLASAGRVVEWTIEEDIAFDLCVVCGDFVPRSGGFEAADDEQEEKLSAEEGEMSAILAQLENTVCRVVYIPGPLDPLIPSVRASRRKATEASRARGTEEGGGGKRRGLEALGRVDPERWVGKAVGVESEGGDHDGYGDEDARVSQLQLTPTSKNLFRRTLRLSPGLSVAGFTQELRREDFPRPAATAPHDEDLEPATPASYSVGERRAGKGGIAWNLDLSGDEGGDSGDFGGYYSPDASGRDASTEFFVSGAGTLFAVEETKAGSGGVAWQLDVVGGGGDGVNSPDNGENLIPFLRTLCRPRAHAARARAVRAAAASAADAVAREEKGMNAGLKRSPAWTLSNSNIATSSSSSSSSLSRFSSAEGDLETVIANGAAATSRVVVQDDSMILLTRTGGPLSCNDSEFVGYGGGSGNVNRIAPATGIPRQEAEMEKEMEVAMARAQVDLAAMAAARVLQRLWAEEASQTRRRSVSAAAAGAAGQAEVDAGRLGRTERGGLLLHVCAGPGAARAVREALASGQADELDAASPLPPRGRVFHQDGFEANGDVGMKMDVDARLGGRKGAVGGRGLGCRIADFTVVALGSLRDDGAHCVVELGFPENLEGVYGRGKAGVNVRDWSVASVKFGQIGVPSVGERAALAHEYSSRGGDQGFIVNFD